MYAHFSSGVILPENVHANSLFPKMSLLTRRLSLAKEQILILRAKNLCNISQAKESLWSILTLCAQQIY